MICSLFLNLHWEDTQSTQRAHSELVRGHNQSTLRTHSEHTQRTPRAYLELVRLPNWLDTWQSLHILTSPPSALGSSVALLKGHVLPPLVFVAYFKLNLNKFEYQGSVKQRLTRRVVATAGNLFVCTLHSRIKSEVTQHWPNFQVMSDFLNVSGHSLAHFFC